MITRARESIIKAIITTSKCGHHERRVRHAGSHVGIVIIALIIDSSGRTRRSPGILDNHKQITRPPESIIKAIIRIINWICRRSHNEHRVRHVGPHLGILIIALIIDSSGRTPRSPGILDNHKQITRPPESIIKAITGISRCGAAWRTLGSW